MQKFNKNFYGSNRYKAFTLVELIVSITILTILGFIAFISISSYSEQSRDSARISDIASLKTNLEIFHIEDWKYPEPTDFTLVSHSWAIVWKQGVFWDSTFVNAKRINKIPTDPLTDSYYTYSVTPKKMSFKLLELVKMNLFLF